MIPPSLDFTSKLFDAKKVLRSNRVVLPFPKVKTYNNIAEYYSHTFLKKGLDALKSSRNTAKPRERNYDWYYDTLGLSEYERHLIRSTKKVKKRKGKKPVSIVTIPGSPLKSEKVTYCKSDFKDYCRRKYRSLNASSTTMDTESAESEHLPMDTKSVEHEHIPYNGTTEPSFNPLTIKTEPCDTVSAKPFIKQEESKCSVVLPDSKGNGSTISLSHTLLSKPPELPPISRAIKTEFLSAPCLIKTELPDSSDDSMPDDILILKMKSNLERNCALNKVGELPFSNQIKKEPLQSTSESQYFHGRSKYTHNLNYTKNSENLLNNSKASSSNNSKSTISEGNVKNSKITPSSQVKDSRTLKNQEKSIKKRKLSSGGEVKSEKTLKQRKRQKHDKNQEEKSNILDNNPSQKSTKQKKCTLLKENSSAIDTKPTVQSIKRRRKSTLKSQENVFDCKKISTVTEVEPKLNNLVSKVKKESSTVIGHCTCKFPCGLSHLCTCGFFASAKEVLNKFKIPRKKK